MKRWYLAQCVVVLLVISACAGEAKELIESNSADAVTKSAKQVLAIDFNSELDSCAYFGPNASLDGLSPRDSSRLAMIKEFAEGCCDLDSLTKGEEIRLGALELPSGNTITLYDLYVQLQLFYAGTHSLPSSAVELFPELAELTVEEVSDLDSGLLFEKAAFAINPVSGRLYGGFTEDSWSPGGIYIEIVDDPVEIANRWPTRRMYSDPSDTSSELLVPTAAWVVTLYGESIGSVIYRNTLWLR